MTNIARIQNSHLFFFSKVDDANSDMASSLRLRGGGISDETKTLKMKISSPHKKTKTSAHPLTTLPTPIPTLAHLMMTQVQHLPAH